MNGILSKHNPERDEIIERLYIREKLPAWDVARAIGHGYGQQDIYILAKRIRDRKGIEHVSRAPFQKVDWELALELINDGTTPREIADFFHANEQTVIYKLRKLRKDSRLRVHERLPRYGGKAES